jgi:hypothetical protein
MHIAASGLSRWLRLSEGRIKYQATMYDNYKDLCVLSWLCIARIGYFTDVYAVISLSTSVRTSVMFFLKCFCVSKTILTIFIVCRPQIRRDYPLNLSILLSGGKETNRDSPSSCERKGTLPSAESCVVKTLGNVAYEKKCSLNELRRKFPWVELVPERVLGPYLSRNVHWYFFSGVGLLESAALSGW